MTDEQVLTAVGAEQAWMEDLLVRLVEAPTTLGDEDHGQAVMAAAFADCGLQPVDVPLDADALRGLGLELGAPVQLQSVVEEECTGNGALMTLLADHTADACVIAEPHPEHITIAQVGVLWFHVDVEGVPAHAAYADRAGFNAIDAANAVLEALRALERELNADPPAPYDTFAHPINLDPRIVSGGDWTSTVAASATLSCRLACFPGDDPRDLQRRVEDTVARAAAGDPRVSGGGVRVRYDGFACEGSIVSGDEPVVVALSRAYEGLHGVKPDLVPTTATTDARHFVRHGVPAICFGPRGERIYGIDERVSLQSMLETAQVLALFVRDWSGAQEDEHTRENTDMVIGS